MRKELSIAKILVYKKEREGDEIALLYMLKILDVFDQQLRGKKGLFKKTR